MPTHSVGAEGAVSVTFGEGVGAVILETMADGGTSVWGTVTGWDPPHRVAYTWHAGTAETEATRVEVTFSQSGPASTAVSLIHSVWERFTQKTGQHMVGPKLRTQAKVRA